MMAKYLQLLLINFFFYEEIIGKLLLINKYSLRSKIDDVLAKNTSFKKSLFDWFNVLER